MCPRYNRYAVAFFGTIVVTFSVLSPCANRVTERLFRVGLYVNDGYLDHYLEGIWCTNSLRLGTKSEKGDF